MKIASYKKTEYENSETGKIIPQKPGKTKLHCLGFSLKKSKDKIIINMYSNI